MTSTISALSELANDSTLVDAGTITHTENNTHRTNYRTEINSHREVFIQLEKHYLSASEPTDKPQGKIWASTASTFQLGVYTDGAGTLDYLVRLASAQTISGAKTFSGGVTLSGTTTHSGVLDVTNTTDATSISTGASKNAGGASITKALWVGGLVNIAGVLTTQAAIVNDSTTDSTSTITGAIQTDGGLGVAKALWVGGLANFAKLVYIGGSTVPAGSPDKGIVLETGAVFGTAATGFTQIGHKATDNLAILVGATATGKVSFENTLAATSVTAASVTMAGGLAVNAAIYAQDLALVSGTPRVMLYDTAGTVDNRQIQIQQSSGFLIFQALNDAGAGGGDYMQISRSGNEMTALEFLDGATVKASITCNNGVISARGKAYFGTVPGINTGGINIGTAYSSPYGGLYLFSTDAVAADVGGTIAFGGYYTGTTETAWAAIQGLKENATDNQYGGYLRLMTRTNGSALAERGRIDSAKNLLWGLTATPTSLTVGIALAQGTIGAEVTGVSQLAHVATNDLQLRVGLTASGRLNVLNTTDSTSSVTGAVITAGGLGVAKALWVGGLANIAGVATLANVTDSTTSTSGGTIISGGLGVAKAAYIGTTLGVAGNTLLGGATAPTALAGGVALLNGTANSAALANGITAYAIDDGGALSTLVVSGEGLTKYHIGQGGADEDVRVGGSLPDAADFTTSTKAGVTGVLKTFTIPAGLLNQNGKALRITAWGSKIGTGGTADIQIRTGTTPTLRATGIALAINNDWRIELIIARNGLTTATFIFVFLHGLDGLADSNIVDYNTITTDTNWSTAQVIDINVSAINAADTVSQGGMTVELLN